MESDQFSGRQVVKVFVGDNVVNAYLARTPEEMRKGLSGVSRLPVDGGMLFEFPVATIPSFWMKDMLIPLDFIWVYNSKVVSTNRNILPPPENTPTSRLQLISPPRAVNYVLEVNAGYVTRNNINVGDTVRIEFE